MIYIHCNQTIIAYFIDYVKSIYHNLSDIQLDYTTPDNQTNPICYTKASLTQKITPTDILILLQNDANETERLDLNKYPNVYLINTEQLSSQRSLDGIIHVSTQYPHLKLIDFSMDNIHILQQHDKHAIFIPYQFTNIENNKLSSFLLNDREYDVAIIGMKTQRRVKISDELESYGLKVYHSDNSWDDERDMSLSKSKIFLNIHAYDECQIYESLRCCRFVFTGKMLVVSETCTNQESLDIYPLVTFADHDRLAVTVLQLLLVYHANYAEYTAKHEQYIGQIIAKRKECLNDIN